jgi:Uma2 family endonuclease
MSDILIAPPEDRSLFSLHPEDDLTQQDSHDEQCTYLKSGLRRLLPDWFVGRELAVYWVPGQRIHPYAGPDILVARNRPAQPDPTVYLTYEDGPLTLVVEVASEETRSRERRKWDETYAAGLQVPEYVFIDLQRDQLELWALTDGVYQPIAPDAQGILWSRELGIGFTWQEDHRLVRLVDPQGQVVPTDREERALREAAEEKARQEARRANQAARRVEREARRAEREARRAEQEAQRRAEAEQRAQAAEQATAAERERAETERRRAEALAAELERLRRAMEEDAQ